MPKSKKQKDPNRPKRPMTAFMCYSQERRPGIRVEQPSISMIEISKIIGGEWREMSDADKRPYHDTAGVAHEAYRIKKEAYDKSKPKRPRTAYAFFMKDNRACIAKKHPDTSPRDLMKYIAESWRGIDTTERDKYSNMALRDRERWAKDAH